MVVSNKMLIFAPTNKTTTHMTITIQYLKEMFDWFNKEHFDGGLEKPMFEITHVKSYLGLYHYKYNVWTNGLAESVIRISDYFDRSEEDVCNTLIHEMIHLYIRQNRIQDTRPHHGRVFNSIADRINREGGWHIARTDSVQGCGLRDKTNVKDYYVGIFKSGRVGKYFAFVMNEKYINYYKSTFEYYPSHYQNAFIIKSNDDKAWASYPQCRRSVRGHYISKDQYEAARTNEVIYEMKKKAA